MVFGFLLWIKHNKLKSLSPMISRTACSNIISSGWYKLILLRSRTWFYQKSTCSFVLFCFLLQVSINLAKTPYIVRRYWEEVIFADFIIYTYICLVLGHIFICSFGQKSNSHGRPANILFKSSFSYHIWANFQKLFVLITCIAKNYSPKWSVKLLLTLNSN